MASWREAREALLALVQVVLPDDKKAALVVVQYVQMNIGELLREALKQSMTSELASHFYLASDRGRKEVILEYTDKQPPADVAHLKRDIFELFGEHPRTLQHLYNKGEPETPSMDRTMEWVKTFYEKKTERLRYSLQPLAKELALGVFVARYMIITCQSALDASREAYVIHMQLPPEEAPTHEEVIAAMAACGFGASPSPSQQAHRGASPSPKQQVPVGS